MELNLLKTKGSFKCRILSLNRIYPMKKSNASQAFPSQSSEVYLFVCLPSVNGSYPLWRIIGQDVVVFWRLRGGGCSHFLFTLLSRPHHHRHHEPGGFEEEAHGRGPCANTKLCLVFVICQPRAFWVHAPRKNRGSSKLYRFRAYIRGQLSARWSRMFVGRVVAVRGNTSLPVCVCLCKGGRSWLGGIRRRR